MTNRNPYRPALAAFGPSVPIIVRLARLVELYDVIDRVRKLPPPVLVGRLLEAEAADVEIEQLRGELTGLGYQVPALGAAERGRISDGEA